jgi:hypothetical protein
MTKPKPFKKKITMTKPKFKNTKPCGTSQNLNRESQNPLKKKLL